MSAPIQVTGLVRGGDEVVKRFAVAGDAIRAQVRKALRGLGKDMQADAVANAPRSSGYRSPASRAHGPLWQSITPRLKTTKDAAKLSIRPTVFYGLMVEAGYQKYAAGQRRWAGKSFRAVTTKAYQRGGATYDPRYDAFEVIGKGKRQRRVKVSEGVRFSPMRQVRGRSGTARSSSRVAGHPFMRPMWARFKGEVQGRIDAAVSEALGAG